MMVLCFNRLKSRLQQILKTRADVVNAVRGWQLFQSAKKSPLANTAAETAAINDHTLKFQSAKKSPLANTIIHLIRRRKSRKSFNRLKSRLQQIPVTGLKANNQTLQLLKCFNRLKSRLQQIPRKELEKEKVSMIKSFNRLKSRLQQIPKINISNIFKQSREQGLRRCFNRLKSRLQQIQLPLLVI